MNFFNYLVAVVFVALLIGFFMFHLKSDKKNNLKLVTPVFDGNVLTEQAIKTRRSIRSYKSDPLTLAQVSQLLWAAQGVTSERGFRTAPSAGALYPLEIYLVVGDVKDLLPGVYKYTSKNHSFSKVSEGDRRAELSSAALSQEWVEKAPIALVICGVYERTTKKYGERATQYVHMEVGCVAQNVYLQAVSLGLGTVFVGAFNDEQVKKILKINENEQPLCILPVGVVG